MLENIKAALDTLGPVVDARRFEERKNQDRELGFDPQIRYERSDLFLGSFLLCKGVDYLVASGAESTYLFFQVKASQGDEQFSLTFLRGFEQKSIFDLIVARNFVEELCTVLPGAAFDEARFPCHSATLTGPYRGADITVTIHAQGSYRFENGDVVLMQERCRRPIVPTDTDMKTAFDDAMKLLSGMDAYSGRSQKYVLLPVDKKAVSSECARC